MLKARDIHKTYSLGKTKVPVLHGAHLSVESGEFVAITGTSGSGKSTLLHILGGLDRPDQGQVDFEAQPISTWRGRRLNRYRNQTVGFVFQFFHLLDELNVQENVLLPVLANCSLARWLGQRQQLKAEAQALLEQVGLSHRLKHKPYQLSGGERQRVAIARALMNRPRLLLADEPTGNLDSATGNSILEVLEQLNRSGQTIIMVTHDEHLAQRTGRVVTLVDGVCAS